MNVYENLKIKNDNYIIIIYGGDKYSKGKKEHDPPHFHVKYDNNKEFIIDIPTVDEWENNKNLNCKGDIDNNVLDNILEWIELENNEFEILNIEYLRYRWNSENEFNDQTTTIDKIFQHESKSSPINKSAKKVKDIFICKLKNFEIHIKGGLDYGKNKNDIKEPHFYLKIDDAELRVLIPKTEDWRKKEYILSGENYDIFKGLPEIYDELLKYLKNPTNLNFIQNEWNNLNMFNNHVSVTL
jgi:hypothetical protein